MDKKSQETVIASGAELQKYKDILVTNGITHSVSEVKIIAPESLQGDGGSSVAYYITITFKDSGIHPLKLFTKRRASKIIREFEEKNIFGKEVQFFNAFIPAAEKFCASKGQQNLMDIYPKCYYADEDMLVFENLVEDKGYEFLRKQERLGVDAAKIALTTLAKHHAITYAFMREFGGAQKFFEVFPALQFEIFGMEGIKNFLGPMIQNGITTCIKILEKSEEEGREEAISTLRAHYDQGFDLIWRELQYRPEDEKLLVLNHGDYWCGNMAFMRDQETHQLIPGVHKALDFQVTRYHSPVLDVGNFMYTSMKPDARRNHLEELLKTYLDVLKSTSRDLGSPIELTYEELLTIFRRKFMYGFWFSIWLQDAGYAVISDLNANAAEITDYVQAFDKAIQKYIEEHPENCASEAKKIVELMREYTNLIAE